LSATKKRFYGDFIVAQWNQQYEDRSDGCGRNTLLAMA
jgi:hypothetical protein